MVKENVKSLCIPIQMPGGDVANSIPYVSMARNVF